MNPPFYPPVSPPEIPSPGISSVTSQQSIRFSDIPQAIGYPQSPYTEQPTSVQGYSPSVSTGSISSAMSSASSPYQSHTPMAVPAIHRPVMSSVYSDISLFMKKIIDLTPPDFISAYGKVQISMLKSACNQVVQLANYHHINATEPLRDFRSVEFLSINEYDEVSWFQKLYQQLNEAICHNWLHLTGLDASFRDQVQQQVLGLLMTIKSSIAFQERVKDIMDRLPAPCNTNQELQKELKAMHFPYFYPALNAGHGNAKTIEDILEICRVRSNILAGNACSRELFNILNEKTMGLPSNYYIPADHPYPYMIVLRCIYAYFQSMRAASPEEMVTVIETTQNWFVAVLSKAMNTQFAAQNFIYNLMYQVDQLCIAAETNRDEASLRKAVEMLEQLRNHENKCNLAVNLISGKYAARLRSLVGQM